MSEITNISWCDSTFNPWIGCTKVSPGCANCYAERDFDHRKHVAKWGAGQPRHRTSEAYWKQPLKWDRESGKLPPIYDNGQREWRRPRVFCASLADWLDDEVPIEWLADLMDLIRRTPHLDWQLLTKRPENFHSRMIAAMESCVGMMDLECWIYEWIGQPADGVLVEHAPKPPANVWIGTTVEDQARADERIPALLSIPARVRFLSCEPMLGPVDLSFGNPKWRTFDSYHAEIHWVICGGESGPKARPMEVEWAQSLRKECQSAGVAFFMKQLGGARDKRHDVEQFPADLQVRDFPSHEPHR